MTHAAPARRKPIPSLYNLKVMAALMVIFIHAQTFMAPAVSAVVVPVCRVAVPLFFMITGYFFYAADPSILTTHARRSAVKLLKLAAVATFVYFAWTVGVQGWSEAVGGVFTAKRLLALCLLGTPLYGDHLWFVFAELVVVAMAPLFARIRPRFLFAAMAVLLCLNLLLFGKYKFLTGSGCSESYARNWLFMGLPFFWMGWLIKKCENKIRLTKYSLSGGVILLVFLTIVEHWALSGVGSKVQSDLYLTTLVLSPAVFLLFLRCPQFSLGAAVEAVGRRDATWIYVFHIILLSVSRHALAWLGWPAGWSFLYVVPLVFGGSLLLSRLFNRFKIL